MATNIQRILFSNNKTSELGNAGTYLHETKCKWEYKIEKFVQTGEEEKIL
jgi:hypothetical protein